MPQKRDDHVPSYSHYSPDLYRHTSYLSNDFYEDEREAYANIADYVTESTPKRRIEEDREWDTLWER